MEDVNTINNIASENVDFSMFALFMSCRSCSEISYYIFYFSFNLFLDYFVSKLLRLRQLKQMEKEFEEIFWSNGNSFEDLYETLNFNKLDPKSKIFCAAISEWKKH